MSNLNINDNNVDNSPYFFICINASASIHSHPYFEKEHVNVINLNFDDVEKTGPKEIQFTSTTTITINAVAMTEIQAESLVNFMDKINKDATVFVYCTKGSSRSGAIEDYLKNAEYPSPNSNKYVFNLLKKVKKC